MQMGDETVYTLTEAAKRLGIKRGTLLTQVRRGLVAAQLVGSVYLITATEVARYDEQRKQPRGFARTDHPMHGKRGGGGRKRENGE